MNERVKKLPSLTGIVLHINARRKWGSLVFLPVWLAGWTVGGIMAMKWVLYPGPSTPRAFISLWLAGWALGAVGTICSWFWTAFGKEIVQIREGNLTIKRDILGRGRTRSFPIGTVSNLRASGLFPSSSYWDNYLAQLKLGGGTIGFDSQGQTHRLGIQLTESEAQNVVQELSSYLS
jgi:hypothetical protein